MKFHEWLKENKGIELWLDDERDPKDPFIIKEFGSKPNMIWVKTVDQAKEILKTGDVIYLSFDNDLGEELEGHHLAKWIEEQAYFKNLPKLSWNVHSQNISGKREITAAMRNADKFWDTQKH